MILGIGNDIIEVARIQANVENQRFLDRIFTPAEQEYCLSRNEPSRSRHFAGRFAAKEAVVKALGTGFSQGLTWLDIEIRHDSQGKPYIAASQKLRELFNSPNFYISISHCHEYATAVAIWIN